MLLPNLPPSSLPGVSSQNTDSSRRRDSKCAYHDGFTGWLTMIPVAVDHASLFMVSFIIDFVCIYCFFFVASGLVTFNQAFFLLAPIMVNHSNLTICFTWCESETTTYFLIYRHGGIHVCVCVCLSHLFFARTWRRYKKLDSNIVRTCFCKTFANNSGWWIRVVDFTQISSWTYCLWVDQHICISVSWMLHPWTECMG